MSYYAGDDPDVTQPWFLKKRTWIVAAVVFCLLVLGLGIYTYFGMKKIPEVGGGVTIEADPDTKIYLGHKLVGSTKVSLTWDELFGDKEHEAMAMELLNPSTSLTPELVSGEGAVQLETQGLGGGSSGGLTVRESGFRYLTRRADGKLDEVIGIIIDLAPANERPRRFLLALRLRKGEGPSSTVFSNFSGSLRSSSGRPGFMKAFGQSPIEVERTYRFSAGTPPTQFAEEIKTKGFWDPPGEQ